MKIKCNIPFIQISRKSIWISLFLLMCGIVSTLTPGLPFGVDFAGGRILTLLVNEANSSKITNVLSQNSKLQFKLINTSPKGKEIEIQSQMNETELKNFKTILSQFGQVIREDFVGPKIGQEFRKIGLLASIFTFLVVFIYISFRFEWSFAIAAIAALFHDVFLSLGFIILFSIPFNLSTLATILFIIGYSLNDTIVIFDRIREEQLHYSINSRKDYANIIDKGLNLSLTRSLLTSLTTLMVLIILFILSGTELKYFSIVLIFGIIVGTFSSNFVAPIILSRLKKIQTNLR